MALPSSADFTSKDYDSVWLREQALIRSVFPTWTDFSITNFGNILAQLSAFTLDVLTYYQDNQAAESRIATATQRRSLIALAKLLGYTPALAAPASVRETFAATGLVNNCTIPAGTVIKTSTDAIPFQLLSDVLLTPGAPTSSVGRVENSVNQTQLYNGTGQPGQTLRLPQQGFLSVVSVSGGWSPAPNNNFLFSSPTSLQYTLSVDNNDVATLSFGDGVNGSMPSGAMTVLYKTGGGSIGNVTPGSITQIDGPVLDVLGNTVSVTATNADAATGGIDRESTASIRLRAPLSIRNPTSSIARTDFEDNALRIPSVGRALMVTGQEVVTIPDNSGILYVVPVGGATPGAPSGSLLDQVRRQFEGDTQERPPYPKPLTFNLTMAGAIYVDFDITARIYLRKNAVGSVVAAAMRAAMTNFFSPIVTDAAWASKLTADLGVKIEVGARNPLIDFGYYLRQQNALAVAPQGMVEISDLMDVVHDVPGVRGIGPLDSDFALAALRVAGPYLGIGHVDVALADTDFPRFSALHITDIDTSTSL